MMWTEEKWTAEKLRQYIIMEKPEQKKSEREKPEREKPEWEEQEWEEPEWEEQQQSSGTVFGKLSGIRAGAWIFALIGAGFILAALWMLGMNFLNDANKSRCLYAVFLIPVIYSELVVYRKRRGAGLLLTTLGLCGCYFAVWADCMVLQQISVFTGILMAALIALFSVFLSRRKDSGCLRFFSMLAFYLCLLTCPVYTRDWIFQVTAWFVLFLAFLCTIFPVRKSFWGTACAGLVLQGVFAQLLINRALGYPVSPDTLFEFALLSFLIAGLSFWKISGWTERQIRDKEPADRVSDALIFLAAMSIYGELLSLSAVRLESPELKNSAVALVCIFCVILFFLMGKRKQRWLFYGFLQVVAYITYVLFGNELESLLCMLVLLMVSKAFTMVKELAVSEGIVTVLAAFLLVTYKGDAVAVWFLFGAMLLSVLAIHRWKSFYELVISFSILAFLYGQFPWELFLILVMAVSFLGLFLFHHVDRWRGKGIVAVDFGLLLAEGICLLSLPELPIESMRLIYLIAFLFGLAVVLLILKPKYQEGAAFVFLAYMIGIAPLTIPLAKTLLLMILALAGLWRGFYKKKKNLRCLALLLSVLVCCKLLGWDLQRYDVMQRMILLLAAGILILLIAVSYLLWDRKGRKLIRE